MAATPLAHEFRDDTEREISLCEMLSISISLALNLSSHIYGKRWLRCKFGAMGGRGGGRRSRRSNFSFRTHSRIGAEEEEERDAIGPYSSFLHLI